MPRLGAVFVSLLLVLGASPAARAAGGSSLVALGDSFSSGEGAPPFDAASGACHRSRSAWPVLLARELRWGARVLACSGAVVDDIVRRQLPSMGAGAPTALRLVTVTAGGNDAGFASVLRRCALLPRCDRWFTAGGRDRVRARIERLYRPLVALYARVQAAAGAAAVAVVGYPRLFPARPGLLTCAALGLLGPTEIRYLNARTADLDRVIARAALFSGTRYVDVLEAFAGRGVSCRGPQWVNHLRLGSRLASSFHPNLQGQRRLATVVARALGPAPGGE